MNFFISGYIIFFRCWKVLWTKQAHLQTPFKSSSSFCSSCHPEPSIIFYATDSCGFTQRKGKEILLFICLTHSKMTFTLISMVNTHSSPRAFILRRALKCTSSRLWNSLPPALEMTFGGSRCYRITAQW